MSNYYTKLKEPIKTNLHSEKLLQTNIEISLCNGDGTGLADKYFKQLAQASY